MILTIVRNYISEDNIYANCFVHVRVKQYLNNNKKAKVFILNKESKRKTSNIDGVFVEAGNVHDLINFINENDIEAVCVHFIDKLMIDALTKVTKKLRIFIFVHGNEALHWYERIFLDDFNSIRSILGFCKYTFYNVITIPKIKSFLRHTNHGYKLIAVSEWMKRIAEKNWKTKNKDWQIIHNIIDGNIFNYLAKSPDQRFKVLIIRSFSSAKYANDISINVIKKLSNHIEFKEMEFCIIGSGILFTKLTDEIRHFQNVILRQGFIKQYDVAEVHKHYGIFLCPTRQDAQGVSMCEAMSSGLIPITLNNTAIPEFVPSGLGLACNNEDEMVDKILEIVRNPEMFINYSKRVSQFINEKCSKENTTTKEINLMFDK